VRIETGTVFVVVKEKGLVRRSSTAKRERAGV